MGWSLHSGWPKTDGLVLVHGGWTSGILPADTQPATRPVEGPVEIKAQVHVPPPNARVIPSQIDTSQWPLRIRSLEIDVISEIFGRKNFFPFEVRLTAKQPGVLVGHWPAVYADFNQNLPLCNSMVYIRLNCHFCFPILASSNLWSLLGAR
ncbi:MAG: hypothetical protein Ct9H90mP25_4700 [Gammaproteobacteria bacterium]|nr:MAG: hypothetical protein Ct9H90mP25_4700 [Gammaproteobacteria bacterium]